MLSKAHGPDLTPQLEGMNFPDPSIIKVGDAWYSFATRTIGTGVNIQVAISGDFSTWVVVHNDDGSQLDALPTIPQWVHAGSPNAWAPDVQQLDDGTFIMYYSASVASAPAHHCVGAATAPSILGPYTPKETALYCPLEQGGTIDAAGYNDNGQRYVVYKVDGNSIGHGGPCGNDVAPQIPTPLLLQPVAADGFTPGSGPFTILDHNGTAEYHGVVEAPSLAKSGSDYYLFFSSGCYNTGTYNLNYATSKAITGPYTRAEEPLLVTGDYNLTAPGGASIDADGEHMVFHATTKKARPLFRARVSLSGGKVSFLEL